VHTTEGKRDVPWRAGNRKEKKDGHFPNEYNPVVEVVSADIL